MATVTFDTHAAVELLIKEGVKKQQAEAIVKTMQQSREQDFSNLVTRDYLKAELNQVKAEINQVKVDILKWILPFLMAIIVAIFIK